MNWQEAFARDGRPARFSRPSDAAIEQILSTKQHAELTTERNLT